MTAPGITIQTRINATLQAVWDAWTTPKDIQQWNSASDDWHTPHAEVDLREGGHFLSRMQSRDGRMGFDFTGTYTEVHAPHVLAYVMDDGRQARITFDAHADGVVIVRESFDAEATHSIEQQQAGWQAILDNFRRYVESKSSA